MQTLNIYDFGLFNDLGPISVMFSTLAYSATPKVSSAVKSGARTGHKKLGKIIDKYESMEN